MLGQRFICPIVPVTQRNILEIDGFIVVVIWMTVSQVEIQRQSDGNILCTLNWTTHLTKTVIVTLL